MSIKYLYNKFRSPKLTRPLLPFSLIAGILIGLAPVISLAADLPSCADGQTLVYDDGKPVCGPACPAYVYENFGIKGFAAFNIPASDVGDIHPPVKDVGLPSGGGKNSIACTFHVQCSINGWVAITTAADTCRTTIWDVP